MRVQSNLHVGPGLIQDRLFSPEGTADNTGGFDVFRQQDGLFALVHKLTPMDDQPTARRPNAWSHLPGVVPARGKDPPT